jgi:hypothetical protein
MAATPAWRSPEESRRPPLPLTRFQTEVLQTLAAARTEDSYFGGGAVLNARGLRVSKAFDIFHDKEEKLLDAVEKDEAVLHAAGLAIDWRIRHPTMHRGIVRRGGDTLLLDWSVDSDFRFFPVQKDPQFGFRPYPLDIATNKLLAAVGREEPRDIVDVMQLHEKLLALGAMVWATAGKDVGLTPELILEELKRASRYQQSDLGYARADAACRRQGSLAVPSDGRSPGGSLDQADAAGSGGVRLHRQERKDRRAGAGPAPGRDGASRTAWRPLAYQQRSSIPDARRSRRVLETRRRFARVAPEDSSAKAVALSPGQRGGTGA